MKAAVLLILGSGLIALVIWANDVRQDRKHTLTVNSPTPVFAGPGEDCYTRQQTTIEPPGRVLKVRRIRYWKECATVDVMLQDGRSGHIILGIGDASPHPPLR